MDNAANYDTAGEPIQGQEPASLLSSMGRQAMNPTGIWSSCGGGAACAAGIMIGLVIAIIIYLAYWFFYLKPAAERLTNLSSQVYGPTAAEAAVLNGMRAGDPRLSVLNKERMTPNVASLWK